MRIVNVCGARPNFMKIAPLMHAYQASADIEPLLVHTDRHRQCSCGAPATRDKVRSNAQ